MELRFSPMRNSFAPSELAAEGVGFAQRQRKAAAFSATTGMGGGTGAREMVPGAGERELPCSRQAGLQTEAVAASREFPRITSLPRICVALR
jgi:hypothetical protein